MWRVIFPILTSILMAAHVLFHGAGLAASICVVLLPLVILVRRPIVQHALCALFALYALEWVRTTLVLVGSRMDAGRPWMTAAAILLACAAFSAFAAALMYSASFRRWFSRADA